MADYLLKDVDPKLWRQVKSKAALQGKNIKDVITKLLEGWVNQ